jgi:integrase/recombinase XerD
MDSSLQPPAPGETLTGQADMTVGESIEEYVRYLRRRGRSEHTIKTYRWGLQELAQLLGAETPLAEVTADELELWQDHLLERGLARRSRGVAVTAVRSWLRWATERDLIDWRVARAVQSLPKVRGRPRPIDPDDLARIKAYFAQLRTPTLRDLRDRALFHLLLTSGFRIAEALSLPRADWRRAVVVQKGGEDKALAVPPTVVKFVDQYLAARGRDDVPWLFVTTARPSRHQLSRDSAQRIWLRLARAIDIRPWTNHQLRHTCGTELARRGLPIQVIAEHLGHEGLATVMDYVRIVQEQQQQKLELLEDLTRAPDGPPGRNFVRIRGDRWRGPRRVR